MFILTDPSEKNDQGIMVPVSFTLKKKLAPWAEIIHRRYDFGNLLIQQLKRKNFSVFIFHLNIEKNVTLYPSTDNPMILMLYIIQGTFSCSSSRFAATTLNESRYEMSYFPLGTKQVKLEPGTYECFVLELNAIYTYDLADKHEGIRQLVNKLETSSNVGQSFLKADINKKIMRVLNEIQHHDETNSLELVMNRSIYTLLAIYNDQIISTERHNALAVPKMEKTLIQIRDYIAENPDIHVCTLNNLSSKFHINSNTLKRNFKNKFKHTLHTFVLDECMKKGRILVLENTDSISSIAMELGYSDKSNFIKAFTKYFNCRPGEMRKNPGLYPI